MNVLRSALTGARRYFSATAPCLWAWPKLYDKHIHGGTQMKLRKYSPRITTDKKEVHSFKLVSGAGHPWYHRSARRKVAAEPDKVTRLRFDPVIQRRVLFHEKKDTGIAPAKLKFTQ
eukprot:TRINITY_DN10156_c0_g1_i1.p2 TRINITY_DN10156_c0_g1~~TRINITY_DN10156_c0_g1_i1.p2  ORF type:complete len:133 (+),score=52.79 TRINITY_DN10156_c0_g1_i1:51-401(+)